MILNKEPEQGNIFFFVYVEWENWPNVKHLGLRTAKQEAYRLSTKTWKKTYILQAIKSYDLVETNYLNNTKVWKHKNL